MYEDDSGECDARADCEADTFNLGVCLDIFGVVVQHRLLDLRDRDVLLPETPKAFAGVVDIGKVVDC
ncbi:hypothetical protein [Plantactinospora sp. DSM 117369]